MNATDDVRSDTPHLEVRGTDIFVTLYQPSNSPQAFCDTKIQLSIRTDHAASFICFDDLVGNGEGSGHSSKGIGTKLVNAALKHLKSEFDPQTPVTGTVSAAGDPTDDPAVARMCTQRRHHFWRSFGFVISDDDLAQPRMQAMLGELHPKPHRTVPT